MQQLQQFRPFGCGPLLGSPNGSRCQADVRCIPLIGSRLCQGFGRRGQKGVGQFRFRERTEKPLVPLYLMAAFRIREPVLGLMGEESGKRILTETGADFSPAHGGKQPHSRKALHAHHSIEPGRLYLPDEPEKILVLGALIPDPDRCQMGMTLQNPLVSTPDEHMQLRLWVCRMQALHERRSQYYIAQKRGLDEEDLQILVVLLVIQDQALQRTGKHGMEAQYRLQRGA